MVELRNRVENRESRARGPLGVVVMSFGPTEVGQNAIAEILGDMAAITGYRFGSGAVIAGHHFAPFLGVELSGNFG